MLPFGVDGWGTSIDTGADQSRRIGDRQRLNGKAIPHEVRDCVPVLRARTCSVDGPGDALERPGLRRSMRINRAHEALRSIKPEMPVGTRADERQRAIEQPVLTARM